MEDNSKRFNGKAEPKELFKQHNACCNGAVTLSLFWIGMGWTKIPRFSRATERALFCKLRRVGKANEFLAFLKTPQTGKKKLQAFKTQVQKWLEENDESSLF